MKLVLPAPSLGLRVYSVRIMCFSGFQLVAVSIRTVVGVKNPKASYIRAVSDSIDDLLTVDIVDGETLYSNTTFTGLHFNPRSVKDLVATAYLR